MADLSTLARPYAKAGFDYAKEHNAISEWQNYLSVMNTIVSDKAFADFLQNPAIAGTTKVSALIDIYGKLTKDNTGNVFQKLGEALAGKQQNTGGIANSFVNFLNQLAEQDRLALLPSIQERFEALKATDAKELHAYVTSAYPLTKAQELLMESRLSSSFNTNVILHVEIDPELIAGVTIKIGDKVIDDSVRGKLKQLKTQLTA